MAETIPHEQIGGSALCSLCDRWYCERHKSDEVNVCKINNATYYRRHHNPGRIFPDLAARKDHFAYWERRELSKDRAMGMKEDTAEDKK